MEDQAQALAMKMVRVINHALPQMELQWLDVSTGRRMALATGMAWEDDGKTIEEEPESDSELLDDSSFMSSAEP